MNLNDTTKERALSLLANNIPNISVARALGVSESYISQLIADDDFSKELQTRRVATLTEHAARDKAYDALEDKLLNKLDKNLPLMHKTGEILKAIQVVNGAKRRGAQEGISSIQQTIVSITLPTVAINEFIVTPQNTVVKAGHQDLVTVQSGALLQEVQKNVIQSTEAKSPESKLQARLGFTNETE